MCPQLPLFPHLLISAPRLALALAVWALGPHELAVAMCVWRIGLATVLGAFLALVMDVRARRAFMLSRTQPPCEQRHAAALQPGGSGSAMGMKESGDGEQLGGDGGRRGW